MFGNVNVIRWGFILKQFCIFQSKIVKYQKKHRPSVYQTHKQTSMIWMQPERGFIQEEYFLVLFYTSYGHVGLFLAHVLVLLDSAHQLSVGFPSPLQQDYLWACGFDMLSPVNFLCLLHYGTLKKLVTCSWWTACRGAVRACFLQLFI